MVDMFLDIETVPDMTASEYREARRRISQGTLARTTEPDLYWKATKGALNAKQGRIVLITYQISEVGRIHRLTEWDSSERSILRQFYDTISTLEKPGEYLQIVGHNISRFDMPFLYTRMLHHTIDEESEVYRRMNQRTALFDTLQMHLPLNDFEIRGLRHDALMIAYGLSPKDASGGDEIAHYFDGEYDKILEYSHNEFLYPKLFGKIKSEGLVSKERLKWAISQAQPS